MSGVDKCGKIDTYCITNVSNLGIVIASVRLTTISRGQLYDPVCASCSRGMDAEVLFACKLF